MKLTLKKKHTYSNTENQIKTQDTNEHPSKNRYNAMHSSKLYTAMRLKDKRNREQYTEQYNGEHFFVPR